MKKIINTVFLLLVAILVAQPAGSCVTGTTQLGSDKNLYGCVSGKWAQLNEKNPIDNIALPANAPDGITEGEYTLFKKDNAVYELDNKGFSFITIPGRPSKLGEIAYINNHFYRGDREGKWIQLDNTKVVSIIEGYCTINSYNHAPDEFGGKFMAFPIKYTTNSKTLDGDCSNYNENHPERQALKEKAKNFCKSKIAGTYPGKYWLGPYGSVCTNKIEN